MNPTMMNVLNAGLWIVIVMLAFVLQVLPFLLVLLLLSISFGLSSAVSLVMIPTVLFGMLVAACWYASVRVRRRLPAPLPVYRMDDAPDPERGVAACMLPHLRRYRMH